MCIVSLSLDVVFTCVFVSLSLSLAREHVIVEGNRLCRERIASSAHVIILLVDEHGVRLCLADDAGQILHATITFLFLIYICKYILNVYKWLFFSFSDKQEQDSQCRRYSMVNIFNILLKNYAYQKNGTIILSFSGQYTIYTHIYISLQSDLLERLEQLFCPSQDNILLFTCIYLFKRNNYSVLFRTIYYLYITYI